MIAKLLEVVATALDRLELTPIEPDHIAGRETVCRAHVSPAETTARGRRDRAANCQVTAASKRRCDLLMLGAFRAALRSGGWDHDISPEGVRSSPRIFFNKIQTLAIRAVNDIENGVGHEECDPFGGRFPNISDVVKKAVEMVEFDREEFRTRAKMVGFDKAEEF